MYLSSRLSARLLPGLYGFLLLLALLVLTESTLIGSAFAQERGGSGTITKYDPTPTGRATIVNRARVCKVQSGGTVCWWENVGVPAAAPARLSDLGPFSSISAGVAHACGVRSDDDSVVCWGDDSAGQATAPTGTFAAVSAGAAHTCGVQSDDDSVVCWGDDSAGQATAPTGAFVAVSAGKEHTCGVQTDDSVVCWGDDSAGQATAPTGTFAAVSAGKEHTCGIQSDDDSVACWGDDSAGQATAPTGTFAAVSAGAAHTCGIQSDGTAACWGDDSGAQSSASDSESLPSTSESAGQSTPPAGTFVSISAGEAHTCGVQTDGSMTCWGGNSAGQTAAPAGAFAAVNTSSTHTCGLRPDGRIYCWGAAPYWVSAGAGYTCGLWSDGRMVCWGKNDEGQASPPQGTFRALSAGEKHTCGVQSGGGVVCWGDDSEGRTSTPRGRFVGVSAGGAHTCGFTSRATVVCWGDDGEGRATAPEGTFVSLSAGGAHTCGVRSDNTPVCWGKNDKGQATAPTGTFDSVSAGKEHTCGVQTDASVVCWGKNDEGQASPPAETFLDSISAGGAHTCGKRFDETVVCWGDDSEGQASPPAGQFISLSAGEEHTCGVSYGEVICWGKGNVEIDGACGSDGQNACAAGVADDSAVADTTTHYQWQCLGEYGGDDSGTCAISKPIAGECDDTVNNGCAAGELLDLDDDDTHYHWQCLGQYEGDDSEPCSRLIPIDGECDDTVNNGCAAGELLDLDDDATHFQWQCLGKYEGEDSDTCRREKPVETVQYIYQLATTLPATPSGDSEEPPTGWSEDKPEATLTHGVYRSQRTVTHQGEEFRSATAWGMPVLVERLQAVYRLATTAPAAPSGGTDSENHVPGGWSTIRRSATAAFGVYRSQRTVTYAAGVFDSATAWGTPVLVEAVQYIYQLATTRPAAPNGGTDSENHVPTGWNTSQPRPTATEGVYRSQRTVTYAGGVFLVATAWGMPIQVAPPIVKAVEYIYQLATTRPDAPSGDSEEPPTGWSPDQPSATLTHGVYRSQRTVTRQGGVFLSATAWETPVLVEAVQLIYQLATTTPDAPSGEATGWSTDQLSATLTHGVYCSQRTVTYAGGVFHSATAWETPVLVEAVQLIYQRATTLPDAPSGGTDIEDHVPTGWSTDKPDATLTQGVYRSQRTVTYAAGVFASATAWETPVLVEAVELIYRRATTTPDAPSGGTDIEDHVPEGWSTSQPSATTTFGVYRSQRTVTYAGGVFLAATAWEPPVRVAAPRPPVEIPPLSVRVAQSGNVVTCSASGGRSPYSYQWHFNPFGTGWVAGDSDSSMTIALQAFHRCTVRDSRGVTASTSIYAVPPL